MNMNKSSGFSLVVIVVLLAFILTSATLLILPRKTTKPMDKSDTTELDTKQETTTTIPTVLTCTGRYSSDKYKFSINCPNGWTLAIYEKGNEYINDSTNPLSDNNNLAHFKFMSADSAVWFEISVNANANSSDTQGFEGIPGASSNVRELSPTLVSGISSQRFSSTGPGSVTITVVTETNDVTFRFIMDDKYWDAAEKAKTDEIYSDLLTSFTFL